MKERFCALGGPDGPAALVWNVQFTGLLSYTANDGNHKLLTYLIELFCPINLLSDTADTWFGNKKAFSLMLSKKSLRLLFLFASFWVYFYFFSFCLKDLICYVEKTLAVYHNIIDVQ